MRGRTKLSGRHIQAVAEAYALIELVQGNDDAGRLASLEARAVRNGWDDVCVLLAYARSLAAQEAGTDDSPYLEAMHGYAANLDDPALLALAWARAAYRRATDRRSVTTATSAETPLVQAIVLLDGAAGLAVHRAAALIAVAGVAHELGFWELASDHYRLTDLALAADDDPRWQETAQRHLRVVAFNRIDLALDWASAHAVAGDWPAARTFAAATLRSYKDVVDVGWPANWVAEHDGQLRLLAALAGVDPLPLRPPRAPGGSAAAIITLDAAIRAIRADEHLRASRLADRVIDQLGSQLPINTHLLALYIAARHPSTPAVAIRYADELAALRWNNRRDRLAGIRDAIDVERRRREHEHLRRQILVDELTGLANRRGYHAYVSAVLDGIDSPLPSAPADAEPGACYAALMIDVDHFKDVNDRFGHDTGDLVLSTIGEILAAHVRPVDLAARLGGDEFVMILADVDPGVLLHRGQEILDAVVNHPWTTVADGLTVSISVGMHHGSSRDLSALLTDADRHLYHAKRRGRGQVAAGRG